MENDFPRLSISLQTTARAVACRLAARLNLILDDVAMLASGADQLSRSQTETMLGMRREGLFREFISSKKDDKGVPIYENTMQYALLRKEWETAHGRM